MATNKQLNRVRRLPTGKTTNSLEAYLRSWKKIANPLAKAMNWKLMAFDPGFMFETATGRTVSMETDVVIALIQAITKK